MKLFAALALSSAVLAGSLSSASAQGAAPMANPDAPHNAAVKSPADGGPGPLAAGHNSFTEDQARNRIQKAGYTRLTGLTMTDQGLWQGQAMKDGKKVAVSMDYRGHVSAR